MLAPRKVKFRATKKWRENIEFRTYLKCNADEKELDEQFLRLHNELFENYDCSRCRNCCKLFHGSIPESDIQKDADYLGISRGEFIEAYLAPKKEEWVDRYNTKHMPCDFLCENGECKLGECRPDSCKTYPYTNQPERLQSLYSVLDAVEVCPVAYEIYERLKEEYEWEDRCRGVKQTGH